jgi:3-dehydroquinate synthase
VSTIRISASDSEPTGYDVIIESDALKTLPSVLARVAPAHRYALLTDSNVAAHWGEAVLGTLAAAGLAAEQISFEAGERNKTRDTWATLTDRMLELGLGRDSCVIALGGGVVGDLAGFVAATYMRGVPVVQVPTSLLAMIDASVGGKTGVDAPSGKNLVGAFYPPRAVLADPLTLRTLPQLELIGGLAEAIKHGAIADAAYFDWIDESADALLAGDQELLAALVHGSVFIKAGFVAVDLHENGARAALNFGHTIGHALERATDYELHHGHAVAIGMVLEARAAELREIARQGTADRLRQVLRRVGLPTILPARISPDDVIRAATTDKKARAGQTRYALISQIGAVARGAAGEWTWQLPPELIRQVLEEDHDAYTSPL